MRISPSVKLTLVCALVVGLLCVTGTAAADEPPAPPNPATGQSGPPTVGSSAAAVAFNCQIQADNPHSSGHFPLTINSTATTTCTPGVFSITMVITLWKKNSPFPDVPIGTGLPAVGSYTVAGNAAGPCVPGTYYTAADAVVVFPVGAFPPFGAIGSLSPTLPITC